MPDLTDDVRPYVNAGIDPDEVTANVAALAAEHILGMKPGASLTIERTHDAQKLFVVKIRKAKVGDDQRRRGQDA